MTKALDDAKTEYQQRVIDQRLQQARLISPPSSNGTPPVHQAARETSYRRPSFGISFNQVPAQQCSVAMPPSQTIKGTSTGTFRNRDPSQILYNETTNNFDFAGYYSNQQQGMGTYEPNPGTDGMSEGLGNPTFSLHGHMESPSSPQSQLFGLSSSQQQQRLSTAINYGQDPSTLHGNSGINEVDPDEYAWMVQLLKDNPNPNPDNVD